MAFPSSATLVSGGVAPALAGITIGVYPSTNLSVTEVQRATAAGAASSLWATVWNVEASSAYEVTFTDRMPLSTRSFFYKARHKRVGFSNSGFTNIVSGKPIALGEIVQPKPVSGAATALIAFGHSTPANAQGSVLPVVTGVSINYTAGGGTTLHMWITIDSSASISLPRPDGTTLTAPATNTYDRPAAPTLAQTAGGALGARTRFVRVSLVKRSQITNDVIVSYRVSTESSLAINANNLLQVTAPTNPGGYDGWVVWVGTLTNTEVCQQQLGGSGAGASAYLAFGATWTEPVGGSATSSTTNTPYAAAMDSGVTVGELVASTAYALYVYFDVTLGTTGAFRIGTRSSGAGIPVVSAAGDAGAASEQNADQHIPMSFSYLRQVSGGISTPAAGGSGSASSVNTPKYL